MLFFHFLLISPAAIIKLKYDSKQQIQKYERQNGQHARENTTYLSDTVIFKTVWAAPGKTFSADMNSPLLDPFLAFGVEVTGPGTK